MIEQHRKISRKRAWWILLSIAALISLAWTGVLDARSDQYLDGALLGSGAIYATARGINGLVSLLQGTEIDVFILTFSIGELLDPVNDLIERFSGVMMLAIGSLALQKILLEVVSHYTFNILLTLFGVGAIATGLWGSSKQFAFASRFFFVTVLVRFSLVLIVLANSWANTIFLKENQSQRHTAMKEFHSELILISSSAGISTDLSVDLKETEEALRRNQQDQEAAQAALYLNRTKLEQAEAEFKVLDDRSILEKFTGHTTDDIEGKKVVITKLEADVELSEYTLAALVESREPILDRRDCLKQQSKGNSCSIAESVANALDVKQQIVALGDQVNEFASNLINLLMSLILKSILLPVLFLYGLLRSVRLIFGAIQ